MKKKYHVCCFPNGRVVFVDFDIISNAFKQGKEILVVCNAWSGGYATVIGGDRVCCEPYNNCHPTQQYAMYRYDIGEQTLKTEDLGRFYQVIFTSGDAIYMKTGGQADTYFNGIFADNRSTVEGINDNCGRFGWNKDYFTAEEIQETRKEVDELSTVVFMDDDNDIMYKIQALIDLNILSTCAKEYIKKR